jgi:hypothetical protein
MERISITLKFLAAERIHPRTLASVKQDFPVRDRQEEHSPTLLIRSPKLHWEELGICRAETYPLANDLEL